MNKTSELVKIAEIHVTRIQDSIYLLKNTFPVNAEKVKNFTSQELFATEMLSSRFSKLQDIIGRKLIDLFLISQEEFAENLTMLDKINKLERLEIITADLWKKMREIRNHVAHEYPDHPEISAYYLNQLFEVAPSLIELLNKIKSFLT